MSTVTFPPPTIPRQGPMTTTNPITCTCGTLATPVAHRHELTDKRRSKFGVLWLLFTLATGGLGFFAWLIWPRHKVVIGVENWVECPTCKRRLS